MGSPDEVPQEGAMEHDEREPRARTLIVFGVCLALLIVAIIAVAAVLGA